MCGEEREEHNGEGVVKIKRRSRSQAGRVKGCDDPHKGQGE